MKKFLAFLLVAILSLVTISNAFSPPIEAQPEPNRVSSTVIEATPMAMKHVAEPTPQPLMDALPEPENAVSDEDVALIALLTMAEAEGECEEGQRLVIDTVLNRVDDPHFPDNIYDVVYQRNQYSGMLPPRIDRCYVKDELVQLVHEELENRTDCNVIFFRTEKYHSYGVPMFQLGSHYFSSYD